MRAEPFSFLQSRFVDLFWADSLILGAPSAYLGAEKSENTILSDSGLSS